MTVCEGCGASVPFEACPSCPDRVIPCPYCGDLVLVTAMPESQLEEILRLREERMK